MEPRVLRNIVGGKPVDTAEGRTSPIIDPVTEEVIAHAPVSSAADVDAALQVAAEAFRVWRRVTPAERPKALPKLARAGDSRGAEFAAPASDNPRHAPGPTPAAGLFPT